MIWFYGSAETAVMCMKEKKRPKNVLRVFILKGILNCRTLLKQQKVAGIEAGAYIGTGKSCLSNIPLHPLMHSIFPNSKYLVLLVPEVLYEAQLILHNQK